MTLTMGTKLLGGADAAYVEGDQQYIIIPPAAWANSDWSKDIDFTTNSVDANVDASLIVAPVILPHNSTINFAIVYGNDSTNTWRLDHANITTGSNNNTIGTTNVNSAGVISLNKAEVDLVWMFNLRASLNTGDKIYGAVIGYTVGSSSG